MHTLQGPKSIMVILTETKQSTPRTDKITPGTERSLFAATPERNERKKIKDDGVRDRSRVQS